VFVDIFLITAQDVIIASGCSGALEIVLNGLLNEGDSVLLPQPGFFLYQVKNPAHTYTYVDTVSA